MAFSRTTCFSAIIIKAEGQTDVEWVSQTEMDTVTNLIKLGSFVLLTVFIVGGISCVGKAPETPVPMLQGPAGEVSIKLPQPRYSSKVSLEESLLKRRSVREYSGEALTLEEVSQLLWAAQGKTSDWGGRTAPSAGALYPLETYLVVGNVESLSPGVYKYNPERHELAKVRDGDVREQLAAAAVDQACVREGNINIIIAAVYERTVVKYGERGVRYVHMEAGHAAQNICLQATALNLGTVTVGAFHDDRVKDIVGLSGNESPLYVIPVGRKKG